MPYERWTGLRHRALSLSFSLDSLFLDPIPSGTAVLNAISTSKPLPCFKTLSLTFCDRF